MDWRTLLFFHYIWTGIPTLFLIGINKINVASGGYYIENSNIPSFLYRKFENIVENVFPQDLYITMSLSKAAGTLMYSVDNHLNQFILTLHDSHEMTLGLEFNMQSFKVSLSQLCGCSQCLYKVINLRIQMRDGIYLQCNEGSVKNIKYSSTKGFNKDYILPYSTNESNSANYHEAHLWLVNIPHLEDVYPNNDQLGGCILNVLYNNREISFNNISENVQLGCKKICKDDICNGGECLETYDTEPLCDCTKTYKNGVYCNRTMSRCNIISDSQYFNFEMIKLSWNTSSMELLLLKNQFLTIRILVTGGSLVFEFEDSSGQGTKTQSTLMKNYEPNREYVVIVAFNDNKIVIKTKVGGSWYSTKVPTFIELRKQTFICIHLRSDNGTMEIVYKTSQKDYTWRAFNVESNDKTRDLQTKGHYESHVKDLKKALTRENETNLRLSIPKKKVNNECTTIHSSSFTAPAVRISVIIAIIITIAIFFLFWILRTRYKKPQQQF